MSIVTSEGGLTVFGYGLCAAAVILFLGTASFWHSASSHSRKLSTKQLVFCAAAMALSFLTSYMKIFAFPYGGSVTLFSMLFICLIGNWYGIGVGVLTGLAYGILQFLQEPFVPPCSRSAAITCWHLPGLAWPALLQTRRTGWQKAIFSVSWQGDFSTLWGDTCTGWITCPRIFRRP